MITPIIFLASLTAENLTDNKNSNLPDGGEIKFAFTGDDHNHHFFPSKKDNNGKKKSDFHSRKRAAHIFVFFTSARVTRGVDNALSFVAIERKKKKQ